jgi:hypothetical protein
VVNWILFTAAEFSIRLLDTFQIDLQVECGQRSPGHLSRYHDRVGAENLRINSQNRLADPERVPAAHGNARDMAERGLFYG